MVHPYPTARPTLRSTAAPPRSPSDPRAPTSAARATAHRWVWAFRAFGLWSLTWKSESSTLLSVFLSSIICPISSWWTMRVGCWTRSLRWAWAPRRQKKRWRSMPKRRRKRRRWIGWRNTSCSATSETFPSEDNSNTKGQRYDLFGPLHADEIVLWDNVTTQMMFPLRERTTIPP